MAHVTEALKHQLLQLSLQERNDVIHFLLDSLDDQPDPDVEDAWEQELHRRAQQIENGEVEGEAAEDDFARLREKLTVV